MHLPRPADRAAFATSAIWQETLHLRWNFSHASVKAKKKCSCAGKTKKNESALWAGSVAYATRSLFVHRRFCSSPSHLRTHLHREQRQVRAGWKSSGPSAVVGGKTIARAIDRHKMCHFQWRERMGMRTKDIVEVFLCRHRQWRPVLVGWRWTWLPAWLQLLEYGCSRLLTVFVEMKISSMSRSFRRLLSCRRSCRQTAGTFTQQLPFLLPHHCFFAPRWMRQPAAEDN